MADDNLLSPLVELSRHYGADAEFVLAGGGNTSAKSERLLWVKASGTALAGVTAEGFVEMDRKALADLLEIEPPASATQREEQVKRLVLAARTRPELNQRPSVECVLHHLMPRRFVVHTHPLAVNILACSADGEALAERLFGDELLWIPYVDPGFILARTLQHALRAYAHRTGRDCPSLIIMQNHGLIVGADTPEEVRRLTDQAMAKIRMHFDCLPQDPPFGHITRLAAPRSRELVDTLGPMLRGLLSNGDALRVVTFDDSQAVVELVGGADGQATALLGPVTPDHIVYHGSFPLWFEPADGETPAQTIERLRHLLAEHRERRRATPTIVLAKGLGLFAAGTDYAAADTARQVYINGIRIMAGARKLGGVRPMTEAQYRFIEEWEVESYRKKVAAGDARRGRAFGKVALVTGAAQGFGLEIAQDLAAEGAHVALADVNLDGARARADELCVKHGRGRALALAINVTDPASVTDAVHEVVRTFGGLDLLVSNAGVLRAGSVKTQSERDFDLVTAVNYKGYFACVQKVAPIMAMQRLARPDAWFDIIQINSKSGLQGSNRNGAYAGSKFGGIGLTQSFAMELVEDGIKVNAICPGNFFDGPLWSDPHNGLFVQYLRSGKVPGAKTVEDVRRAYEAKVPMGRGCSTPDVMKAIYYLMEQNYETGQAVPVTGGQVMLS